MKKLLLTIIVFLLLISPCFGAGATTTATVAKIMDNGRNVVGEKVTILITADGSGGAVTSLTISSTTNPSIYDRIYGKKLGEVVAYPTAGGTAPDAADVTVKRNLLDLLGGNGVNLIHATSTLSTYPMIDGYPAKPRIYQAIVIAVANHTTNSAHITIELIFDN